MSKVGFPGVDVGLSVEDPTIAELLKPLGYATGQFGKNHLGDLNKHLPTVHGFDEFFGNLYHLNAEEEPELPDYPSRDEFPRLHDMQLPRGVIHSWATEDDTGEEDPRTGRTASSASKTPARCRRSAWRRSTTRRSRRASTSFSVSTTPPRRSSCG